jgi:pSer/pThr/pTyr-binding forkhead associated (FHA) protein
MATVLPDEFPVEEMAQPRESWDSDTAQVSGSTPNVARLILKLAGVLSDTVFTLAGERAAIGKFDPATGPVDFDLGSVPGSEYISRRHGELYYQNSQWLVRDLGSANGIFLRKAGTSEFSPRLVEPAALQSGDEIAFGNVIFKFEV